VRISEALLKRGDAAIDAGNQEVNRLGESDPVRRLLIALIDDVKSTEENVRSARSSLKATIDEISTGGKQLDGLGRDAIESAISDCGMPTKAALCDLLTGSSAFGS